MDVALDELPDAASEPSFPKCRLRHSKGREGGPVVCASLTGLDSTLKINLNGVRTSNLPREENAVVVDV